MNLFLNTISLLLIVFINVCHGKNTFSFYNLDEAFQQANRILNYSKYKPNPPKSPQRDLDEFFLGLKSSKYALTERNDFSNVSIECESRISQFFDSLKNKEIWAIQSELSYFIT